ncbi:MAG: hydrogenase formation protein HypD [Verrucomicrobia bacterium]|nr:hydrogenase formation protein HypD [Verrucomicrobiota bacterium]
MNEALNRIAEQARRVGRNVTFMEVCGTHTMAVSRSGLRQLLPANVKLISGPGCPVCVTDTSYIDAAIELARRPGVIVTTFGDLIRVPGSESSLERERAAGADVRVVYSPADALALARENPDKQVVFLGVGFETTAPTVAWTIKKAAQDGVMNFSVLCAHKTMPFAMEALLKDQEVKIDGFICPGHVSVITGAQLYRFIPERYGIPCVVCGFEAVDVMKCIVMLLAQIAGKRTAVEIEYSRSVNETGNPAAQQLIAEVFEESDAGWRGIGVIPRSGLAIRKEFARWDAGRSVTFRESKPHPGCRCGDVLRGVLTPPDCKLFAKVCTPTNPLGPCMVSSEGACAAFYKYERKAAV